MTDTPLSKEERQEVYDLFKELHRLGVTEIIGKRLNRYGKLEPVYRLLPGQKNEAMNEETACPGCRGTGTFELMSMPDVPPDEGFQIAEVCRPCGGTGRITPQQWREWCVYAYGEAGPDLDINWHKPLSVAELDEKTAALLATLTPAEQERAKSLWDEIVAVQGVGGPGTARNDWLECLKQTIAERDNKADSALRWFGAADRRRRVGGQKMPRVRPTKQKGRATDKARLITHDFGRRHDQAPYHGGGSRDVFVSKSQHAQ